MTFEQLVSELYSNYKQQYSSNRTFHAKIKVGNEYASFDDYNINEFLRLGVSIHELNIQTISMHEKIVTPDTYKNHTISHKKLFVKIKGMFNNIRMILPTTEMRTYEEQPIIIPKPYQIA